MTTDDQLPFDDAPPRVEVRRSKRRRRSVSAYRDGDTVIVLMPASVTKKDEPALVREMLDRLERTDPRAPRSDAALLARAEELIAHYLPGLAPPASVRWVSNQQQRWGSCTVGDRTIRITDRLQHSPDFVINCVLLHELVHLQIPNHSQEFHAAMARYPDLARAEAYLEGFTDATTATRQSR
mgnify:FL=1